MSTAAMFYTTSLYLIVQYIYIGMLKKNIEKGYIAA